MVVSIVTLDGQGNVALGGQGEAGRSVLILACDRSHRAAPPADLSVSLSLCLSAGCRATKSLHARAWLGAMEMIVAEFVEFRVPTHAVSEQSLEQVSFRQFLSFTVG